MGLERGDENNSLASGHLEDRRPGADDMTPSQDRPSAAGLPRRRPLGTRLAIYVALSVATVVILVMAAGTFIAQSQMDGDLRETAEVTAFAVADDIELRPDSVPPDTLVAVLRSFLDAAADLESITVYRASGGAVQTVVSTATVPT